MNRNHIIYQTYLKILQHELISAMGCTEPIAVAYCAAYARSVLGALPDKIVVEASGNIIKNVKSVIVPNTGGRKGIAAAACIGVLAGNENAELEVISHVSDQAKEQLGSYMDTVKTEVKPLNSEYILDLIVTVFSKEEKAAVRIANEHTNIIKVEKNGTVLLEKDPYESTEEELPDYSLLSVKDIYDFATTCETEDVRELLSRQIIQNSAIADEGLKNDYGANIGKVLLKTDCNLRTRAKAYAAAGSDARMNGCELPVVICSGSGNQGMTASLPIITYARELNCSEEKLYRALLISNLITIHLKAGIGRLSAYCGAVSAGAGSGAGIAYLLGGAIEEISHTIVNALAITSGIVCDGAKSSCAAKIATAVETGIFGYEMYKNGQQFYGGDGLVVNGVEESIRQFARLARIGMRETDREIILMMTEKS